MELPATASDSLFLAVADGHGSTRSFRSDRGARFATECALRLLEDFERRNGPDIPLSSLRRQMKHIWPQAVIDAWHQAVREDIAIDPFSPLDFAALPDRVPELKKGADLPFAGYLAYGATLVAAAVTPRHIIYAQLGDGDILIVDQDGAVTRPWPREHEFYSTETVSICSHHAAKEFKVHVQPRRGITPALILLATDGYANCFADDDGFFTVGTEYLSYLRSGGVAFVQEQLEHWLVDSSRDGSGDDITVALALRISALK